MVHTQATEFTLFIREILTEYFINKTVLDVGSGDINGNNNHLFEYCKYIGNDVIKAPNVSIVSKTKDLPFTTIFDTIISTECFEHDPEYKQSLLKIYSMLKSDGLLFFTCASTGRAEHGTRQTSPNDSYGTIGNLEDMVDYYKNLTEQDIKEILPSHLFSSCNTYYNSESHDLYFVGIKKGKKKIELKEYINPFVENTTKQYQTNSV
jgi:SAM-dependent methyltransferase